MSKKVSIIIPCHNQEKYIKEAIDSALNQTYKNVEIVVLDDFSTDKSVEIIEKIAKENDNIKFIKENQDRGVVHSRNKAIEASSGEYILPLDGDDKIAPTYVEKAVKILDENPDIGIVYAETKRFQKNNRKLTPPKFNPDTIMYQNQIVVCALFKKKDFIEIGGYKEYMEKGLEDWDLWLSFIEKGIRAKMIKEPLFFYRKTGNSRGDECNKNLDEIFKQLFIHHLDLYLNNKYFFQKLFKCNYEKQKKYQKLFNTFLAISIIEFILLICIKYFL